MNRRDMLFPLAAPGAAPRSATAALAIRAAIRDAKALGINVLTTPIAHADEVIE